MSVLIIFLERSGQDSKHIIMIQLNIVLNSLCNSDTFISFINDGPMVKSNTILGETPMYLYIAHVFSFVIYGLFFDGFKWLVYRLVKPRSEFQ
jgi:hypothetical protein